jgi:hypothetical protein
LNLSNACMSSIAAGNIIITIILLLLINIVELSFIGRKYTWNTRQEGMIVFVSISVMLLQMNSLQFFNHFSVTNVITMLSDHLSISITFSSLDENNWCL